VVIPPEIREQFNLKPGQKLDFIPFKETLRVVIVPTIEEAEGLIEGMNTDHIREEVNEQR
jgi:AbrB family looped-hinge helix DNA binding protein